MPQIDTIVVHCSDSPHGRGDDAETIHRWHQERKWDGIGYHYVILEDGTVQAGRPEYWMGSHVKGYNANSLGICLIGVDKFTDAQKVALVGTMRRLNKVYPSAKFVRHSDLDPGRSCPNLDIRDLVEEALG